MFAPSNWRVFCAGQSLGGKGSCIYCSYKQGQKLFLIITFIPFSENWYFVCDTSYNFQLPFVVKYYMCCIPYVEWISENIHILLYLSAYLVNLYLISTENCSSPTTLRLTVTISFIWDSVSA